MQEKNRGFEWTNKHLEILEQAEEGAMLPTGFEKLELPKRSTKNSAGYDFQASSYVTIPSVWKQAVKFMYGKTFGVDTNIKIKPTLVATNVKAYMGEDEVLELYNRSSNPLKKGLILANSVGIIDSDYYSNPDNDGHIMFQFWNFGFTDVTICPGDKIGQGIFKQFLKADGDNAEGKRESGFGSTGK